MALSATIYKFTINLSDLNRQVYDTLQLTVARHPSENSERMMARVMAFCIHSHESLEFTRGLSTPDTPDIWLKNLHGGIDYWIEVGEPATDKIRKACRQAKNVWVYSFNAKSEIWWQQVESEYTGLAVSVLRFSWSGIQQLAEIIERSTEMSVTISDNSAFVATAKGECELPWVNLKSTH